MRTKHARALELAGSSELHVMVRTWPIRGEGFHVTHSSSWGKYCYKGRGPRSQLLISASGGNAVMQVGGRPTAPANLLILAGYEEL